MAAGTLGCFGAFAAAARLFGLDEGAVIRGLGIVASLGSGLRGNFGTMTKPLHAGRAAENGVVAARLAQRGFTATPDILEGSWGFFNIMGGGFDGAYLANRLGRPYQLESPGVALKPYLCGSLAHPIMDAVRDLVLAHDIRPAEVGLREYTDEVVAQEDVQGFLPKVNVFVDPAMEARQFDKMHSTVQIHLKSGQTHHREATVARGYPERPFTREDHLAKFAECAEGVLPREAPEQVWEAVMQLETLAHLEPLTERLVP